jgi:hypothetical protein
MTVSPNVVQTGQLKRKLAGKGSPCLDGTVPPEKRERKPDADKSKEKNLSLLLCARIKEALALQKVGRPRETWFVPRQLSSLSVWRPD